VGGLSSDLEPQSTVPVARSTIVLAPAGFGYPEQTFPSESVADYSLTAGYSVVLVERQGIAPCAFAQVGQTSSPSWSRMGTNQYPQRAGTATPSTVASVS
jgi:hypothetical protein